MQVYEMVFALRPGLDEEAIKSVKDEIQGFIGQNGGEMEGFTDIGKRKLAYEVKKEKEAYFIKVSFSIDPSRIEDLLRWVRARDNVIRVMVTRKPSLAGEDKERRKSNVRSE
ncbi:30S ribosomal protein S6 [Candidatus Aerophobetes bacterium]|uniref:Small ribosomal subunit protein bS6 n=1 Tax=Aerophobetes bacterium TaxID=2030807 RepID=A0A662DJB7_UNCAE|nr:MAG: 30S ribosomal protein S6 [Candidatus Aerophobetes bacterium]